MTAAIHLHTATRTRLKDQRNASSPQAPRSRGPCSSAPPGGRLPCQAPALTRTGPQWARVLGGTSCPRLLASLPKAAQARATYSHLFTHLHGVQRPPLLFVPPIACYLYKYHKNLEFGKSGLEFTSPFSRPSTKDCLSNYTCHLGFKSEKIKWQ